MTVLFNELCGLEPMAKSLFAGFTGADNIDVVSHDVDGGSVAFTVGEVVTGDGGGAGSGTILAILASTGSWTVGTHTGAATLILGSVTGTFTNNEGITGDIAGIALSNGTGTSGTIPGVPTGVVGNGIASIEAGPGYDATSLVADKGLITVTLTDPHAGLLMVKSCVISSDTADDWEVMVVSEAVATAATKTVVLQILKGGTAAAATPTEKVKLELVLAGSSMKPLSY